VARQPEVVVGAEHRDPLAVDDRFRALIQLQGLEEGIKAKGFGLLDQGEVVGLGEDVLALDIVISIDGDCVN
jgi:hypothetical protein